MTKPEHTPRDGNDSTQILGEVGRLLAKLNLTRRDGLRLLVELLAELDAQIEEYDAVEDGLPF